MPGEKKSKTEWPSVAPDKRVPLGERLPPVKKVAAPSSKEIDRTNVLWDELMPEEWRGLLDAKPLGYIGTPAPRFYWDAEKRVNIRASDGHVVTMKEKRDAMLIFQKALKGK